jgi:predicted lipoprotein with Yx(FWY)xxD motif
MRKSLIIATAVLTTAVTVAFAQMTPTKTGDSAKGKVLTNDNGMTLYVFDKDSSGKSDLQRSLRGQLATLDGCLRRHADGRLQRHHP